MNRTELITMSPLVLAYLGDTVFESHIREYLITKNINKKVNDRSSQVSSKICKC